MTPAEIQAVLTALKSGEKGIAQLLKDAASPDFEVVEYAQGVVAPSGRYTAELSTQYAHANCDVWVLTTGLTVNPATLYARIGAQEEVVGQGKYGITSATTGDVGAIGTPARILSARGYAATRFRCVLNGGSRPTTITGQVTALLVAWGKQPTIDRQGTWWPPLNVQGSGASNLLLNWDCPLPSPARLSSIFAYDNRSTSAAADFLMFFDQAITTNAPPANGTAPIPGLVFPLGPRPGFLSIDTSNRDRRFFNGITWALSTTGDVLTLDVAGTAQARVDVETN